MSTADIIDEIIEREGGYVDHEADRGGPTKYGITLQTLRNYRDDHTLGAEDIRALSRQEARDIYRERYLRGPGIDQITDDSLRAHVLDCAVLYAPRTAIEWLQTATGAEPVDGLMGPITRQAVDHAVTTAGAATVHCRIVRQRILSMARLVRTDRSQGDFIVGWCRRALDWLPG